MSARCRWPRAPNPGTSARRPRRRSGRRVASSPRAAADHAHDLDDITFVELGDLEGGSLEDLAVELDRDGFRAHTQLLQVGEQCGRPDKLHTPAVDLQRDHWKSGSPRNRRFRGVDWNN